MPKFFFSFRESWVLLVLLNANVNLSMKTPRCARILVLDGDAVTIALIQPPSLDSQYEVRQLTELHELEKAIHVFRPDVVVLSTGWCGLQLHRRKCGGRSDGESLPSLAKLLAMIGKGDRRQGPALMLLVDGSAESSAMAIELLALGAEDCVAKPILLPQLAARLDWLLTARQLLRTPTLSYQAAEGDHEIVPLVGRCDAILSVHRAVGAAARHCNAVLVRGESGTGKTLTAMTIHRHSGRPTENMRIIRGDDPDAGDIPAKLAASCLPMTWIVEDVDLLPRCTQSRLLDWIRGRPISVGNHTPVNAESGGEVSAVVMTMQATSISHDGQSGALRRELFYELRGGLIDLPPLRDRGRDLELLINYYVSRLTRTEPMPGQRSQCITDEAQSMLCQYGWPGNVAELRSVLLAGLQHGCGVLVANDHLRQLTNPFRLASAESSPLGERLTECESGRARGLSPAQVDRATPLNHPHLQLRSADYWTSTIDALLQRTATEGDPQQANDGTTDGSKVTAPPAVNGFSVHAQSVDALETGLISAVLRRTGGNLAQSARLLGMTRVSLRKKIHSLGLVIPGRGVST